MTKLPEGWVQCRLGDTLLKVIGGGTPSRKELSFFDGAIPWFTVKDMKSAKPTDAQEHISETALLNSATNLIPANTLTVATRIALGRAIRPTVPYAINQDLKALISGEGMEQDFLLHWFEAHERVIQNKGSGTTVSGIRLETLHEFELLCPPSCEQTRIVTKLEELLSALDAGVAELKAAQKKLSHYRQSLLKAAVSGDLTAAWREKNPPQETGQQLLQRILRERRTRWEATQLAKFKAQGKALPTGWKEKYAVPVQPDVSKLPQLPDGWVWASGDQLCDLITKGTTPPKEMKAIGEQTIPFLRVTNLTSQGTLDLRDEVFVSQAVHTEFLARSIVFPDDVLMNIVGPPLGQVVVAPNTYSEWNINQAIAIFRPVDTVLPKFLCRYLLSNVAQKWFAQRAKTTAGQTNLTLEMCRTLPMPVPPMSEQIAIVDMCEAVLDSCSQQVVAIEASLKQSTAQRKNILQAAFSGQLVPQDPTDEPASALLARIRAAREATSLINPVNRKIPRGRKAKAV